MKSVWATRRGADARAGIDPSSLHKHAVPIGIEPVFLLDRMPVGFHDRFLSSKGTHKHKEGGLRQMEICQQSSHYAEFTAGTDEDIGLAAARPHSAVSRLTSHILQSAYRRRSDRDHASS